MLIVSRRYMESIVLRLPDGTRITVTVAGLDRGVARLGVEAPREVGVWRSELLPPGATQPPPREKPQ